MSCLWFLFDVIVKFSMILQFLLKQITRKCQNTSQKADKLMVNLLGTGMHFNNHRRIAVP